MCDALSCYERRASRAGLHLDLPIEPETVDRYRLDISSCVVNPTATRGYEPHTLQRVEHRRSVETELVECFGRKDAGAMYGRAAR